MRSPTSCTPPGAPAARRSGSTSGPRCSATLDRWLAFDRHGWAGRTIAVVRAGLRRPTSPSSWPSPTVGRIAFHGQIDRVDELPDGTIVVTDHKTGKPDGLEKLSRRRSDARRHPLPAARSTRAAARSARSAARTPRCAPSTRSSSPTSSASALTVRRRRLERASATTSRSSSTASSPACTRPCPQPPTYQHYVGCWFCEPDGLGTAPALGRLGAQAARPALARVVRRRTRSRRPMAEQLTPPARRRAAPARRRAPRRTRRRASASAPTRRRRCSSRPAPAPARRPRSSGASSRSSTKGVPIDEIAAITFTEKAAAELRHRLRAALDRGRRHDPPRRPALDALDHAPIGTLHAFARRILFEFPVEAGLPPGLRRARRAGEPAGARRALGGPPRRAARRRRPRGRAGPAGRRARPAAARGRRSAAPRACAASSRTSRPTGTSSSSASSLAAAGAPGGCDARPRRVAELAATPVPRRRPPGRSCWPTSPPRRTIVHDGDLGTMLDGLDDDQEAHRQGRPASATRTTGAATAAPTPSTPCAPRSWPSPSSSTTTSTVARVPPARRRGDRRALRARRRPRAGGRRHARVPRPPRARPPPAGLATTVRARACTSATGGSCSTSSRTPTRSSWRSPCG